MWSLLHYAGVRNQRPGWDFILVVFWAVLVIAIIMSVALTLGIYFKPSTAVFWTILCVVIIPLAFLTRWGVRRTERLRFEEEIERCRAGFSSARGK